MKLHYLLTLPTFSLLTSADPFDPKSVSLFSPITFYCPGDAVINLSADSTVVTIRYEAPGRWGQKNLIWEAEPSACFVQVPLRFRPDTWNSVSMVGLQYAARKLVGEAKAKAVWSYPAIGVSGVTAPTYFPAYTFPNSTSRDPGPLLANTTYDVGARCCNCGEIRLNVRTVFDKSLALVDGNAVEQKVKLAWDDDCKKPDELDPCLRTDVDGKVDARLGCKS
ncbi:uncharacterized protein EI97DRAFT_488074 [Westerdykella ornata]|uniref:Uncharacterized protein n=1 Tax=Westerdykella ornata TaxID=318751 RepID=A0A6A6JPV8_WESOR|nr:uncharacterized protein EI97DRAFT_488074 [Westerdykella ornata]KAF2277948.1 hypothetical protein EI97DRAFT_488074 [Westerdykella ornata]